MFCDWKDITEGVACIYCGTVRPYRRGRECQSRVGGNATLVCRHLADPIERDGVKVKVKCGCTKKDQEVMLPAHKCELHRRCLPTARFTIDQLTKWTARDESRFYKLCQTCKDNPCHNPKP